MRNTINMAIKNHILSLLSLVEFTHVYGFGIRDNGLVKVAIVENADEIMNLITVCELTSKSHGAVYGVRMWNSSVAFNIIKEYARELITLCTVNEFERIYAERKANGYTGNRGNLLEDLFAEFTGAIQNESKTAKCTECGDVVLNGEHIQMKLWNATVTTEPQVERFYADYVKESK